MHRQTNTWVSLFKTSQSYDSAVDLLRNKR